MQIELCVSALDTTLPVEITCLERSHHLTKNKNEIFWAPIYPHGVENPWGVKIVNIRVNFNKDTKFPNQGYIFKLLN